MAKVPGWAWVVVKNPKPVHNLNNEFAYGDHCGIMRGGQLKVLGTFDHYQVLVSYTAPEEHGGTPCPTGTVFLIRYEDFKAMTLLADAIEKMLDGK